MWCTLTAVLSFFFLFLYDIFQVRGGRVHILLFSIIGYGGLFLAHFFLGLLYFPTVSFDITSIAAMILGGIFLLLLFYSLFVEIPLQGTYGCGSGRRACTSGTYGIIRHPGFLWFGLFQVCLMILFRRAEVYLFSLAAVLLDFFLIFVEDVWIFPRLFDNYAEYKKKVPFLIPGVFGGRNE